MDPDLRAIHVLRKDGTWEQARMSEIRAGDRFRIEDEAGEFTATEEPSVDESGVWGVPVLVSN